MQTSLHVRLSDVLARFCITVGGLGTIAAVIGVFVFLVWVAWPLFWPARLSAPRKLPLSAAEKAPLRMAVDEYGVIGWILTQQGELVVFRADTGEQIERRPLLPDVQVTAAAFLNDQPQVAIGAADGTVRRGEIAVRTRFREPTDLPAPLRDLKIGARATAEGGVIQRTPQGEFRLLQLETTFNEPIAVSDTPIKLVDQLVQDGKSVLCVLSEDGKLRLTQVTERRNLITDEVTQKTRKIELPYEPRGGQLPRWLHLIGRGETIVLIWEDGTAQRIDARDLSKPVLAEQFRLLDDPAARVTAVDLLLGRRTLVVGDSQGGLTAWFGVRADPGAPPHPTSDELKWTAAHKLPAGPAAVTALSASSRSRLLLAGYASGSVQLMQVTTESSLLTAALQTPTLQTQDILDVTIGPKDDRLYALSGRELWSASLEPRHPEVSFSSLMLPVWYEDYPVRQHVWQSTGGTADFEPKLGLVPLIFGTLKATFYSLLFGVPLALMAAVYASEFMSPKWRGRIKPTIELMASLPSVVLGFLAGNMLAHLVENIVPQVLSILASVPLTILLAAFLWQLLPQRRALLWQHWRFPLIGLVAIPAGMLLGWWAGPVVELVFFAGNIMRWLDRQIGSGVGAWMMLLFPLSAVGVAVFIGLVVNPWLQRLPLKSRAQLAWANLVKFLAATVAAVLCAMGVSALLSYSGLDPRAPWVLGGIDFSYVDTYVQRNALIVGFIMGFAIIPIIYTIAEDALTTVPEHLRSASLAAGATPWQTAVRVVVPTAMSGLFSAVMIGLGRAVGETMIVLMAAGNTPILKMNIFDGFRTLAANIAVEMPEAPRDSTHYRVLFLAALTLFVMTFVVNTAAEVVRQRFRKRAYQL